MTTNKSIIANATCGICYEEMSLLTVNIHDINPCNFHCCEQCAFTYLAQKIKEKDISSASLTCPSCREPLTSTDVHRVLDAVRIQEHQDEKAKLLVMFDEAFEVQSKVDKEKNRRLQRRFPSAREVASDVALSCWSMGAHTRRCPGCRNLIEKNGGCQHMTCRTCRHEFWWCCGQSYGNSNHNEVLCLPFVYMNHQSRYWGPNVLVRTVTKTAVLGVGVGIAATAAGVAAVALPTVYIVKKIDKKSGWKDARRNKRSKEHERRYEQQQMRYLEREELDQIRARDLERREMRAHSRKESRPPTLNALNWKGSARFDWSDSDSDEGAKPNDTLEIYREKFDDENFITFEMQLDVMLEKPPLN